MWERRHYFVVLLFGFIIILSGCGTPSEDKVKQKVEKALADIQTYKVQADMNVTNDEAERTYVMDVWYEKRDTDFYRVTLHKQDDEESKQIILKNEEGVFVLTPKLNKSFKFQADWPKNNRQPYLLQTVMQDILDDRNVTMIDEEDFYVFETVTNYQNNPNLPYQNVYIDKKTHLPKVVQLLDEEKALQMEVTFHDEQFETEFAKNDFDRKAILDEALAREYVDGEVSDFVASYPLELLGATLDDEQYLTLDNGIRAITTFKGEKNFTLIQEQVDTVKVGAEEREAMGEVVHLGHSIGVLSANGLEWNANNVHYQLASDDLSREEMIAIAVSMEEEYIK